MGPQWLTLDTGGASVRGNGGVVSDASASRPAVSPKLPAGLASAQASEIHVSVSWKLQGVTFI